MICALCKCKITIFSDIIQCGECGSYVCVDCCALDMNNNSLCDKCYYGEEYKDYIDE